MRLVLDTNVVASAMLWGGNPYRLLVAGRDRQIELFTSLPLLAELTDILNRWKFEKKIAASRLAVDQLVDRYTDLAAVVRPMPVPRVAPDQDDDVLIATALAARASAAPPSVSPDHQRGRSITALSRRRSPPAGPCGHRPHWPHRCRDETRACSPHRPAPSHRRK